MSPRTPVRSKLVVLVRLNYQAARQAAAGIGRELKFGDIDTALWTLDRLHKRFVIAVIECPRQLKHLLELKRIAVVVRNARKRVKAAR